MMFLEALLSHERFSARSNFFSLKFSNSMLFEVKFSVKGFVDLYLTFASVVLFGLLIRIKTSLDKSNTKRFCGRGSRHEQSPGYGALYQNGMACID